MSRRVRRPVRTRPAGDSRSRVAYECVRRGSRRRHGHAIFQPSSTSANGLVGLIGQGPARRRVRGPLAMLKVPGPACPLLHSLSWPSSWASRSMCRESPMCVRTSRTCTDPPWDLTSFPQDVAPRPATHSIPTTRLLIWPDSQDLCPRWGHDPKRNPDRMTPFRSAGSWRVFAEPQIGRIYSVGFTRRPSWRLPSRARSRGRPLDVKIGRCGIGGLGRHAKRASTTFRPDLPHGPISTDQYTWPMSPAA
jgi:hypothetical protein